MFSTGLNYKGQTFGTHTYLLRCSHPLSLLNLSEKVIFVFMSAQLLQNVESFALICLTVEAL